MVQITLNVCKNYARMYGNTYVPVLFVCSASLEYVRVLSQ